MTKHSNPLAPWHSKIAKDLRINPVTGGKLPPAPRNGDKAARPGTPHRVGQRPSNEGRSRHEPSRGARHRQVVIDGCRTDDGTRCALV